MLRWITLLAGICIASAAAGLGFMGSVEVGARSWCLALAAVSATLLISSFDAYETERPASPERDDS